MHSVILANGYNIASIEGITHASKALKNSMDFDSHDLRFLEYFEGKTGRYGELAPKGKARKYLKSHKGPV